MARRAWRHPGSRHCPLGRPSLAVPAGNAGWDGQAWSALGSGFQFEGRDGAAFALAPFDDGSGPSLAAAGVFDYAGEMPARHVARWDGKAWTALGDGHSGLAYDLLTADLGDGPVLLAGGTYLIPAGEGTRSASVARWDGAAWVGLGDCPVSDVRSLEIYDGGDGPELIVGGQLGRGGAEPVNVARWDGATWSALGQGWDNIVFDLAVFDRGDGPRLVAGGNFQAVGGIPMSGLAYWDGAAWRSFGAHIKAYVRHLTVADDGRGPALFAFGRIEIYGVESHVARWDGRRWQGLGRGEGGISIYSTMIGFDGGRGPGLFVGAAFELMDGTVSSRIARWACHRTTIPPLFADGFESGDLSAWTVP